MRQISLHSAIQRSRLAAALLAAMAALLLVAVCGCGPSSKERTLRYNACVNEYLLEASRKVGVPTDRKPTRDEVEVVQAEVDRKCGDLK